MKNRTGWKDWIIGKLPLFVFLFCLIQPLLDIAGFWQSRLGVGNAVTMALRMVLLAGSVLLGFLLSDRKRYYFITAAVLLLLTAGHIVACRQSPNGYREPVTDLVNLVRIYFLPMMTLCFITFLRRNEKVFPAMRKGMLLCILLIALVQLLSTLTKTDPHTYSVDSIGVLGWFLWTNSQSAVLGMLAPIAICWTFVRFKGRILPLVLVTAIAEAALFFLAPRLSFFSMIFCGVGTTAALLLTDRKSWKQAVLVLLITALFTAAYPWSPTQKRLSRNAERMYVKQERISEELAQLPTLPSETPTTIVPTDGMEETDAPIETTPKPSKPKPVVDDVKKARLKQLEKIYKQQSIIWSMVSRFGFDKVYAIYDETTDAAILSSTRTMKINFCRLLMKESGTMSHLFGLNLKEMTMERHDKNGELVVVNFDVENDFHGIYFLTGWVGLGLMILFLLWFGVRALLAVIRRPKQCFNAVMASFLIAYAVGICHACFTASVLRRNNASVYLALVLAGLWFLSAKPADRERPAQEEQQENY